MNEWIIALQFFASGGIVAWLVQDLRNKPKGRWLKASCAMEDCDFEVLVQGSADPVDPVLNALTTHQEQNHVQTGATQNG